ncbi:GNAT family N-acetyltransferase [Neolewinella persica]|uniref:GNAT family N-acetyltransferase n=1 Tax=Neolewinella persica TaxID=70998 RepID=UPI00036B1241|nr:GNAT family N-acetyltransferase [Neolewinella persica]
MSTQIRHFITPLPARELDRYLKSGWRPAGQGIYTADFLRADDEEIYGCIQVRLPLEGFTFKKRHRKILNKNNQLFRVTYDLAEEPDEELLELNRRYMAVHPDKTREDLDLHVTGEYLVRVLDTRIVRVYDGDKLVAFSYFDLGAETAYTKAGIYDPDYARFSLGIYTMLLEIAWLSEAGIKFYHPGYVSPRYSVFDYKLQFGDMQYRQVHTGRWLPFDQSKPEDLYTDIESALQLVVDQVRHLVKVKLMDYPSFTARYHYQSPGLNLLDCPLLIRIDANVSNWGGYVVTYDVETHEYHLVHTRDTSLRDVNIKLFSKNGRPRIPNPLTIAKVLITTPAIPEIVEAITQQFSGSGIEEDDENNY